MKHKVNQLTDYHYEIAAIENIIALKDHGLLTDSYKVKTIPNVKLLKLSKYIQRIMYAVSNVKEL